MNVPRHMRDLLIAGGISFALHLLMGGAIVAGMLSRLPRIPVHIPEREPPRMRLIAPPQPPPMQRGPNFVDTTGLKEEKPPEPTPNISAQDTRLRSPTQGNLNLALPTQEGVNKPGLTLMEMPETPPMPQEQPQPPSPETPNEKKAEMERQEAQKQAKQVPEAPRGILPRPMDGEEKERPRDQPKREEQQKKKAAAAPAPFEFKQDKTALEGGMVTPGDASVDSRATPLGEYQAKVYRAIGSQWKFMVRQQRGLLDLGTVAVEFIVRRDGMLGEVKVDYNTSSSAMLQTISENSIRLVAPFPPFPESVHEQVGDELQFDVKFTIY